MSLLDQAILELDKEAAQPAPESILDEAVARLAQPEQALTPPQPAPQPISPPQAPQTPLLPQPGLEIPSAAPVAPQQLQAMPIAPLAPVPQPQPVQEPQFPPVEAPFRSAEMQALEQQVRAPEEVPEQAVAELAQGIAPTEPGFGAPPPALEVPSFAPPVAVDPKAQIERFVLPVGIDRPEIRPTEALAPPFTEAQILGLEQIKPVGRTARGKLKSFGRRFAKQFGNALFLRSLEAIAPEAREGGRIHDNLAFPDPGDTGSQVQARIEALEYLQRQGVNTKGFDPLFPEGRPTNQQLAALVSQTTAKAIRDNPDKGLIRQFDIEQARDLTDKAADIGGSLTAFLVKLAIARKLVPPQLFGGNARLSDMLAWELANTDGPPGQGALMSLTLGMLTKVGQASKIAKAASLVTTSAAFASIEALQGGNIEDQIIAATIPAVLMGIGTLRGVAKARMSGVKTPGGFRKFLGLMRKDALRELGLKGKPTDAQIQVAFRARVKQVHPDLAGPQADARAAQMATEARDFLLGRRGRFVPVGPVPVEPAAVQPVPGAPIPVTAITPPGAIAPAPIAVPPPVDIAPPTLVDQAVQQLAEPDIVPAPVAEIAPEVREPVAIQAPVEAPIEVAPVEPVEPVELPEITAEVKAEIAAREVAPPVVPEVVPEPAPVEAVAPKPEVPKEVVEPPEVAPEAPIAPTPEGPPIPTPPPTAKPPLDPKKPARRRVRDILTDQAGAVDLGDIGANLPASRGQKALAHILAKDLGLSTEEYQKLAQDATGSPSMTTMTTGDASKFIAALQARKPTVEAKPPALTDADEKTLWDIARNEDTYIRLAGYVDAIGGVPKNPQLRGPFLDNMKTVARTMRRHQRRTIRLEQAGKEINVMSQLSSSRVAIARAEILTGVPLQALWDRMVSSANAASIRAPEIIDAALSRANTSMFKQSLHRGQGDQIRQWLAEEDVKQRDILWNDMDAKARDQATELHKVLQNEAAAAIREARWRIWDRIERRSQGMSKDAGRKLSTAQKAGNEDAIKRWTRRIAAIEDQVDAARPPNAPEKALKAGRVAKAQGKLSQWAAKETWGTRKFFFMSKKQLDDLVSRNMPRSLSEELEDVSGLGPAPKVVPDGLKTREGKALAIGGRSPAALVMTHLERAMVANATADQVEMLWDHVDSAGMSKRDIATMRKFIENALGMPQPTGAVIKTLSTVSRTWWRLYFISPVRATWFFTRNIFQTIAIGPSQVPPMTYFRSVANVVFAALTGKAPNPYMGEDFRNTWKSEISQKRQLGRQFLRLEEGNIAADVGNIGVVIMDMVGQIGPYSDEINRGIMWFPMHQAAYDQVTKFRAGKTTFAAMSLRLNLETVLPAEFNELIELLDKNDDRAFIRRYAKIKTQNVHFKYETSGRSALEQDRAGRLFLGLVVWQRGLIEAGYHGTVKPLIMGLRNNNYRQAAQGLRGMIYLFLGMALANWITKKVTGRDAYDLWDTLTRYSPMAPGASTVVKTFQSVQETRWRAEQNGWTTERTLTAIAKNFVDNLEIGIVGADLFINIYEANNDKAGVRLWRLIKKQLEDEYQTKNKIKFKEASRDTVEKIRHSIFGGDEFGAKSKPVLWRKLIVAMRNKNAKEANAAWSELVFVHGQRWTHLERKWKTNGIDQATKSWWGKARTP